MDFIQDTRGFRNNNPGNIRRGNDWQGEKEGSDPSFECFESVEYGIRAIHILLDTFEKHYNVITIEDIINRYAPPHENHTDSYIDTVYQYMTKHANPEQRAYLLEMRYHTKIKKYDLKSLFIGGLILVENGFQPFNFKFIEGCENV